MRRIKYSCLLLNYYYYYYYYYYFYYYYHYYYKWYKEYDHSRRAPFALSVGLDMYTLFTAGVRCHLDCVFKILSTKQQYETYLQQTSRIARCACFVREILEYRFLGSSRLRYGGLCRLRCSMLVTLHCERIFTWVHDTCRGKVIISTKFANSCKQSSKLISHTREVWKMYSDYLISLNVLLLK